MTVGAGFPKIGMHKESLNISKKAERRSNFYDVGTMLIAGVIGWLMGKVKIPTSPAILGLILGPMAEKNFRTALLKSSGNVGVFFNTPICWFFLALIAVTLFGAVRGQLKKKAE